MLNMQNKKINTDLKLRKGAVVFIDAVGTKIVWTRSDPKKFIESWERIVNSFRRKAEICNTAVDILRDGGYNCDEYPEYEVRAFSDTIILHLSYDINKYPEQSTWITDHPLNSIGGELISPLYNAIVKEGIYLRGVISFGEFYASDSIIIGPAVEEAAEWYEQSEWFGVSTTPSATYSLEAMNYLGKFNKKYNSFIKYDVPIKNDQKLTSYAVLWPQKECTALKKRNKKIFQETRQKLLDSFSFNRVIGILSELKYRNTLSFCQHRIKIP